MASKDRLPGADRDSLGEGRGWLDEKNEYASRGFAAGVLNNLSTLGVVVVFSCSMNLVQFESMWSLMVVCLTGLPQIGHETIIAPA
jgi:hypothetical protein